LHNLENVEEVDMKDSDIYTSSCLSENGLSHSVGDDSFSLNSISSDPDNN